MDEKSDLERLGEIHRQLQKIADEEARSAVVNGEAARGAYSDRKRQLWNEADQIIDRRMEALSDA